jgi:colanic acid biosynthesis glycosyl transferase WcaI
MPSKLSGMLASGKAIVATAFPATSLGQIIDKVGILAPPGDTDALAEKIKLLANDADKRTELGKKGRAWVLLHWAKAEVLQNLQDEIKSMIE